MLKRALRIHINRQVWIRVSVRGFMAVEARYSPDSPPILFAFPVTWAYLFGPPFFVFFIIIAIPGISTKAMLDGNRISIDIAHLS